MTTPDPRSTPVPPSAPAQYAPPQYAPPSAGASVQPAAPAPRRSPLAIVAFIAGLATSGIGTLGILLQPAFMRLGGDYTAFQLYLLVQSILVVILGLVALVFGVLALVRREPARALAGAGTALGGAAVFSVLIAFIQGLMLQSL